MMNLSLSIGAMGVAKDVVGMPTSEAAEFIHRCKMSYRVVKADDLNAMVTADVKHDRINLTTVNGIVTEATVG
jgi:hypothetical protein